MLGLRRRKRSSEALLAEQERLVGVLYKLTDELDAQKLSDKEYDRLLKKIAKAEDDFQRAQEDFDCLGADDDDEDEDTGERLSVGDAADIWMSSGMDEDRTFGYSEEELRRALEE
jgi:hypothetical protein